MNIRALLLILALGVVTAASAVGQPQLQPQAAVGTWRASAQHPSGVVLTTTVQFTQDQKFKFSATADDKAFMEASGRWAIKGNLLEWRYDYSSNPAIPAGSVDTDEIISATATELRLTSRLSGKTHTYRRVN